MVGRSRTLPRSKTAGGFDAAAGFEDVAAPDDVIEEPADEPVTEPAAGAEDVEDNDADTEFDAMLERARDAAAETDAVDIAYIKVAPSDNAGLSDIVQRKLRGGNLFLRTGVACHVGQAVAVTLVHPDTDAERVVTGTIRNLVGGDGDSRGVLMRFDTTSGGERQVLQRFVVTGGIDARGPTSDRTERLDAFAAAAASAPVNADRQVAWGWSCLADGEDPAAATEAFLAGLALDSARADTHLGLALAYAMAGDSLKAYAFVRSARTLTQTAADA